MSDKLPEWPEEPAAGSPSHNEFLWLGQSLDAALARMEALVEVLHMLNWSCDDVHHDRADRHADDAPCPVVCRINELLAACERRKVG